MLKAALVGCILTEAILVGYAIGKYRLDAKAVELAKRKATDAIAYAKAVPPASPVVVRRTLGHA